jgi:hypothetical protein
VPALCVFLSTADICSAADPVAGWLLSRYSHFWIRISLPVLRSRIRIRIILGSCIRNPDPHQGGKMDPDPDSHQSEKQDSDPHQIEKVEALGGHFGEVGSGSESASN